jgi:CheY-like chemotaxis protein
VSKGVHCVPRRVVRDEPRERSPLASVGAFERKNPAEWNGECELADHFARCQPFPPDKSDVRTAPNGRNARLRLDRLARCALVAYRPHRSMRDRISSRRLRRSLRVLVLDEHAGSRRMLCFVLGSHGHQVMAASTPAEALALLREFHADGVVYDWSPRGEPIRGLGRQLRACALSVRAVVIVSSRDAPSTVCDEEGVDGYFTKPCAMGDVARQLEAIVRSPSSVLA